MGSPVSREISSEKQENFEAHVKSIQNCYENFQHRQTAARNIFQLQCATAEFLSSSQHSTKYVFDQIMMQSASLGPDHRQTLKDINDKLTNLLERCVEDITVLRGRVMSQQHAVELLDCIRSDMKSCTASEQERICCLSGMVTWLRLRGGLKKKLACVAQLLLDQPEDCDFSGTIQMSRDLQELLLGEIERIQALAKEQRDRLQDTKFWCKAWLACAVVNAALSAGFVIYSSIAAVAVGTKIGTSLAAGKGVSFCFLPAKAIAAVPAKSAASTGACLATKSAAVSAKAGAMKATVANTAVQTQAVPVAAVVAPPADAIPLGPLVLSDLGVGILPIVGIKTLGTHFAHVDRAAALSSALVRTQAHEVRLDALRKAVSKSEDDGRAIRSFLKEIDQDNAYFYNSTSTIWEVIQSDCTGKVLDMHRETLNDLSDRIRKLSRQTRKQFDTWVNAPSASEQQSPMELDGPQLLNTCSPGNANCAEATSNSHQDCFLANTAFRTPEGHLVLVENLLPGTRISLQDGTEATVKEVLRHPRSKYPLTEVVTSQATLKVSRNHPFELVSPEDDSQRTFKLAGDLTTGDRVFVGSRVRPVVRTVHTEERTQLFEVSLEPDGAVESLVIPAWGLQTRCEPCTPQEQGPSPSAEPTVQELMATLAQVPQEELLRAMPKEYSE